MKSIWNVLWKDLIRFRLLFGGWTLFIVSKHLFFASISGAWGNVHLSLLFRMQGGWGFALSFVAEPLLGYFVVAQLVYEDPPAGKDPFWVTRPITGAQLLTAKLVTAGFVFVAWPILLSLPWWIEGGYHGFELLRLGGIMGTIYLIFVLVGLAVASVTDGYPRFILWTVAGLAAVVIALILPSMLLKIELPDSADSRIAHVALAAAVISVVSSEFIWHQHAIRFFRKTFVAFVLGTLVGATGLFCTPLLGLSAWFRPADRPKPEDASLQLSVAGPMRVESFGQRANSALVIPFQIERLPASATAYLNVVGTWKSRTAKTWTAPGASPPEQLLNRVARNLLNLPGADGSQPVEPVKFLFDSRYAPGLTFPQMIAAEATSFHGAARLHLREYKLLVELPLREQSTTFEGGSLSISDLERHGEMVVFHFTTRVPTDLKSPNTGVAYIGLLNRSTGELIDALSSTSHSTGFAQINLVQVSFATASFKIPATPGWLDGATLVALGVEVGHTVSREIEVSGTWPK